MVRFEEQQHRSIREGRKHSATGNFFCAIRWNIDRQSTADDAVCYNLQERGERLNNNTAQTTEQYNRVRLFVAKKFDRKLQCRAPSIVHAQVAVNTFKNIILPTTPFVMQYSTAVCACLALC